LAPNRGGGRRNPGFFGRGQPAVGGASFLKERSWGARRQQGKGRGTVPPIAEKRKTDSFGGGLGGRIGAGWEKKNFRQDGCRMDGKTGATAQKKGARRARGRREVKKPGRWGRHGLSYCPLHAERAICRGDITLRALGCAGGGAAAETCDWLGEGEQPGRGAVLRPKGMWPASRGPFQRCRGTVAPQAGAANQGTRTSRDPCRALRASQGQKAGRKPLGVQGCRPWTRRGSPDRDNRGIVCPVWAGGPHARWPAMRLEAPFGGAGPSGPVPDGGLAHCFRVLAGTDRFFSFGRSLLDRPRGAPRLRSARGAPIRDDGPIVWQGDACVRRPGGKGRRLICLRRGGGGAGHSGLGTGSARAGDSGPENLLGADFGRGGARGRGAEGIHPSSGFEGRFYLRAAGPSRLGGEGSAGAPNMGALGAQSRRFKRAKGNFGCRVRNRGGSGLGGQREGRAGRGPGRCGTGRKAGGSDEGQTAGGARALDGPYAAAPRGWTKGGMPPAEGFGAERLWGPETGRGGRGLVG